MNLSNINNTSFDSDIGGGSMRKSTSIASLASSVFSGSWFILDVAGKEFRALRTALTREPSSFLAKIVEEDVDTEQLAAESNGAIVFMPDTASGRWQLDSNSDYFEYILKYLRTGKFNGVKAEHSLEDLLDEAELFRLNKLADICRQKIYEKNFMQQQQRTFSTSTCPSEASLYGCGNSSITTTPSSSVHHLNNQKFVPLPTQQMFYPPPGLFPHPPQMGQPPPVYSQPPPGFERLNINMMSQPIQQQQKINKQEVFNNNINISTQYEHNHQQIFEEPEPPIIQNNFKIDDIISEENNFEHFKIDGTSEDVNFTTTDFNKSDTVFDTPIQNNFKIDDISEENDLEHFKIVNENINLAEITDFKSKNFRVPAFEISVDGRIHNYEKVLPIRKRHTQKFLKYLNQSDKSIEFAYFNKFGVEMGSVLFYLQRLSFLYPEGCSIKQYCDYELIMKNARQSQDNEYFNNTVPSVVLLLQAGDLLKFDDKGKIIVVENVCKVNLLCLRQNLCSNLFRFLLRRKQYRAPVQLLLEEMIKMVPSNVESFPDTRCLLSICNRFPAVFELICNENDNYDFTRALLALNDSIVEKDGNLYWRVVLDCDCANINYFDNGEDECTNYGSCFCDCENCQSLGTKLIE